MMILSPMKKILFTIVKDFSHRGEKTFSSRRKRIVTAETKHFLRGDKIIYRIEFLSVLFLYLLEDFEELFYCLCSEHGNA